MGYDYTIVSPPGRAQYPKLNTPDREFDNYGTGLILEPGAPGVDEYLAQLEDIWEAEVARHRAIERDPKFPEKPKPWGPELDDDKKETGNIVVRFRVPATWKDGTSRKPHLQDAKGNPARVNIGGGSTLRIGAGVYSYCFTKNKKEQGIGIRLEPTAVRVLELREFVAGAHMDFGGEDDGFVAESEEAEASVGSGDF